MVRVAFAFVNGTYLALSGLRPTQNIEVELTHGTSKPEHWIDKTLATQTPSPVFHNISIIQLGRPIELQPTESKFAPINTSMLISDGVALAAEIIAYGSAESDVMDNSSVVFLNVFIGYKKVAHSYEYDSFKSLPFVWNTTSRQYELHRYLFLPFQ